MHQLEQSPTISYFSYKVTSLVTQDQPYLFATIFKHFIYVCFQLLIFLNENQLKLH